VVHGEYCDLINANEERCTGPQAAPTPAEHTMAITPRSKEGQVHYFQIDQPPGIEGAHPREASAGLPAWLCGH